MAQMAQMAQETLGNTKPKSPPNKRIRSRKWCITVNNWTEEIYGTMTQEFKKGKFIIGKEVGEEKKTPHLQAYIEYKNPIEFSRLKKLFPTAHIEKAKGNTKQNYDYCSKEGNFETNIDMRTKKEIRHQEILADEYKDVKWKDWQKNILDILDKKPDKRKIYWYYEETGNVGKSYLCKYLALTKNVIIASGKQADIFNQVLTTLNETGEVNIILLDVPRTVNDYISYSAIEQLKNGCLYSGKYEGGQCLFKIPHIICFSNEEPRLESLSADRWCINRI